MCWFTRVIYSNKVNLHNVIFSNKAQLEIKPQKSTFNCCSLHSIIRVSRFKEDKFTCRRTFHTTGPKGSLPPIVWVVIRGLLKLTAVLTGIGIRRWWLKLPQNRKDFIRNQIQKNKGTFILTGALTGGLVYSYYVSHIVEDPITKRKKFLLFTEKQIRQLANVQYDVIMKSFRKYIITSGDQYLRAVNISKRILRANSSLPGADRHWAVLVIDKMDIKNAFVLPSGHIFIFSGILTTVNNDDQLATIVAHEMAHALLCHAAETASHVHLLEMLMLIPLVALWALLPETIALSSHLLTEYISVVFFRLPFNRKLEIEADSVGLEMMSRACYDPREASAFWRNMETLAARDGHVHWLSSHPSYKTRYETLDRHMPKAFRILTTHCRNIDTDPRSGEHR